MQFEGQTATNPRTGERVVYRAGQWQPANGAAPRRVYGPAPQPSPQTAPQRQRDEIGVQRDIADLDSQPLRNAQVQAQTQRTLQEVEQERQRQAAREQAASRRRDYTQNALSAIDEARSDISGWSTGLPGQALSGLGGTQAHDLVTNLDTVVANVGFDRLQQMRAESPTGGALGPVSDFENRMLQASLASLRTSQSQDQLRDNLDRVEMHYLNVMNLAEGRPRAESLEAARRIRMGDDTPPTGGDIDPAIVAGQRSPNRMDYTRARTMDDSPREEVVVGGEEQWRDEQDPALAGVNAEYQRMLRSGAPRAELVAFLRRHNIDPREILNFDAQLDWRSRNPRSEWNRLKTRIDNRRVRRSGTERTLSGLADNPIGAAVVSNLNTLSGNHLDNIAEAFGANGELVNRGLEETRRRYPISSLAGDMAGGASLYGIGRAGLLRGAALLGRTPAAAAPATGAFAPSAIAGDAAMGAYIGSGAYGTDLISPEGIADGLAGGIGGGVVARGAINTLGRAISPTGGALAPAYAEGVQPSLGQRVGGAFDRFEQATASVPMLGGAVRSNRNRAIGQWEVGGFNRALRNLRDPGTGQPIRLPAGTQPGTEAHAFTQRAFQNAYQRVLPQMRVRWDRMMDRDLRTIARDVRRLTPDSQGRFATIAEDSFLRRLNNNPAREVSGDDFQAAMSELGRTIRNIRSNPSGDTELASVLESLETSIANGARRHSPRPVVRELNAIDRGYAMLARIEGASQAVGRGPGRYTPNSLLQAERRQGGRRSRSFLRGDGMLTDYGVAGQRLGDSLPNSGTWDRALATGAVGGAGYVSPYMLAIPAAGIAPSLPGIRNLVNAAIAPNRAVLAPIREQIQRRARFGGLLGSGAGAGYLSSQ